MSNWELRRWDLLQLLLLVVIIQVTVARWTGFSLVGTSIDWIPVGAIIGGGFAASGYFFGALYTQSRAGPSLLILMVIIAGLAYFLIYWFDYTHREVNGTRVRDVLTFWEFVHAVLTNTHLVFRFGKTGAVGVLGYILAFFEFLGFLFGGFAVYFFLDMWEVCPSCHLYMKSLLTKANNFDDVNSVVSYIETIEQLLANPQTPVTTNGSITVASPEPICLRVTLELLGCPNCKCEVLKQSVAVRDGDDWNNVESLARAFQVPAGLDVRSSSALKLNE